MSTKFSAAKGVQKTPKVCRPPPIIIPPGPFPAHCDIRYGTNWWGTDTFGNHFEHFHTLTLKWIPGIGRWSGEILTPSLQVSCHIWPQNGDPKTMILTYHGHSGDFLYRDLWYGLPYVEGSPWTPTGHESHFSSTFTITIRDNFTM